MPLPTLPANPQPIDYEIQKFVEWVFTGQTDGHDDFNWGSPHYVLMFMRCSYCKIRLEKKTAKIEFMQGYFSSMDKKTAIFSVLNQLYEDVRSGFKCLSDVVSAKPIEVEPLVFRNDGGSEQLAYFAGLLFIVWPRENGWSCRTTNMDFYASFQTEEEAKNACNEYVAELISAQIGRPVAVKGVSNG